MANECLVTKLKGVVNNPDLPKFGVLRITTHQLPSGAEKQAFEFSPLVANPGFSVKATIHGEGAYFTSNPSDPNAGLGTVVQTPVGGRYEEGTLYVSNTNGYIEIEGKYDALRQFTIGNACSMDISDLKYAVNLWGCTIRRNNQVHGNLDDLKDLDLYGFNLWSGQLAGITGDIFRWASMQHLNTLRLGGTINISPIDLSRFIDPAGFPALTILCLRDSVPVVNETQEVIAQLNARGITYSKTWDF